MDTLIDAAFAKDLFSEVKPMQISWERLSKHLSSPNIGKREGSIFALAKIPEGPCKNERVEHVSAVVFDIDNKVEPFLAISHVQDKINSAGFKGIIYSTYSHTVEVPRFRIILLVDKPIKPENYRSICKSVAGKLGITDDLDESCLHAARRYFEPRCHVERKGEFQFIELNGEPIKTDDFLFNTKTISAKKED